MDSGRVGRATLWDENGRQVPGMTDPSGGRFDAAGDFGDYLYGPGSSLFLQSAGWLDAMFGDDECQLDDLRDGNLLGLLEEIDSLLDATPGHWAVEKGQAGSAWRGLRRLRVMVQLCLSDDRLTLRND